VSVVECSQFVNITETATKVSLMILMSAV